MAQLAAVLEDQRKSEETALITGSEAIAVACKLADVDVITAYPIRPYDTVMQYICKLVARHGNVEELIAEERSAMRAGSSQLPVRHSVSHSLLLPSS